VFPPAPPELIGEQLAILSLGDLVTSLEKSDPGLDFAQLRQELGHRIRLLSVLRHGRASCLETAGDHDKACSRYSPRTHHVVPLLVGLVQRFPIG